MFIGFEPYIELDGCRCMSKMKFFEVENVNL